ncbi:hypothetical protein L3i22_023420 [Actinoplanes sp. L3-i22]|nr:hypothetical protein L3i22_023420 [Actinoplanes sp. L3-i22]
MELMGSLRLWRDDAELDGGPRQQRCLLALLLARAGQPIGMTDLVGLIWGNEGPASAVNVVHKYVGALRRLLEPGLPLRAPGSFLARHGTGYRFLAVPGMLDLLEFRRLVAEARSSLAGGRPDQAVDRYAEAARLVRGPAGDGLADNATAATAFAGIDGEFFDAVVAAARLAVRTGRPAELLAPLRLATEMAPLSEPLHAGLVTTLAAAGHRAEALARYRQMRDRLVAELGVEPGPELTAAQRHVLTRDADPAVPASAAAPPRPVRPAQLPPDQPLFAGRETELSRLLELAAGTRDGRRTGPLVIAVDGMAGVGKSTLVTHFAHRVAADFTAGQLHLDLQGHLGEGSLSAGAALRALLHGLGARAPDVPDTFDALVGMYRSLTAGLDILILLDNAYDPPQVRPLLPNSAGSLVLITSRRALTGLAVSAGARLFHARLPELPEARELFRVRLAATGRRFGDQARLDEIIELCGRLPLALAILAARLGARPQLSPATVAADLRDGARRLDAFTERGGADPRGAFAWSYRQLSPGAARLFRLLSAAPGPGITAETWVRLAGQDPERTRAEVEELAEAALICVGPHGVIAWHVLVRAYAAELLALSP